jgi:hypothetical protein
MLVVCDEIERLRKHGEEEVSHRRRPIRIQSYVWCDHHGEIHGADRDFYDEGAEDCAPLNWRPVYVLGVTGEDF